MPEAGRIDVANLASEVAAALALAVERSDRLQKFFDQDDAVVLFNPIIRFGGWIALGRGGLERIVQAPQLEQ